MKTNKKLYPVALLSAAVVLFLLLISSVASASITETKITTHKKAIPGYDINGNTIVWTDLRGGNQDVFIYDLVTKIQLRTTNLSNQYEPAVYGSKVVWTDERNGGYDIYLQDLATKRQTRITSGQGKAMAPDIYGNRIVWMDNRGTDPDTDSGNYYNIYMYDILTNTETQITHGGYSSAPKIYDNRIVWLDGSDGYHDIHVYDLATKTEMKITRGGTSYDPAIYGDRIVWRDWQHVKPDIDNNVYSDIYVYDLFTKKLTQITNNASEQTKPDIDGNSIVWEDWRNGNGDIYAYDLTTKQQVHVIDAKNQYAPKIYKNKIIWLNGINADSGRNGSGDIILGTLSFLPTAGFTATPITGKRPLNVQFTDKSIDEYYYSWNFGDKTSLSTLENPTHKYANAGKYTVVLTVKNAAGSTSMTKSGYITVK